MSMSHVVIINIVFRHKINRREYLFEIPVVRRKKAELKRKKAWKLSLLSTFELEKLLRDAPSSLDWSFGTHSCFLLLMTSYLEGEEQSVFRNVSVDVHGMRLVLAVMRVFRTSDPVFCKVMIRASMTPCECKSNNHTTTKTLFCYPVTRSQWSCMLVI